MLTLKPEYVDQIIELIRDDFYAVFNTITADPSEYPYYYQSGFAFAFDKTE